MTDFLKKDRMKELLFEELKDAGKVGFFLSRVERHLRIEALYEMIIMNLNRLSEREKEEAVEEVTSIFDALASCIENKRIGPGFIALYQVLCSSLRYLEDRDESLKQELNDAILQVHDSAEKARRQIEDMRTSAYIR